MPDLIDITGKRFSRLVVIERSPFQPNGQAAWLCRCDCGNETVVISQSLRGNGTKSCGCLKVEQTGLLKRSHDASTTRLAKIWYGMRKRCHNSKSTNFKRYGGRGISICEQWQAFESFQAWALGHGYQDGLTIERINNDGDYEPSNCEWITRAENIKRAHKGKSNLRKGKAK
jgi:hypothetical protein